MLTITNGFLDATPEHSKTRCGVFLWMRPPQCHLHVSLHKFSRFFTVAQSVPNQNYVSVHDTDRPDPLQAHKFIYSWLVQSFLSINCRWALAIVKASIEVVL